MDLLGALCLPALRVGLQSLRLDRSLSSGSAPGLGQLGFAAPTGAPACVTHSTSLFFSVHLKQKAITPGAGMCRKPREDRDLPLCCTGEWWVGLFSYDSRACLFLVCAAVLMKLNSDSLSTRDNLFHANRVAVGKDQNHLFSHTCDNVQDIYLLT